MRNKIKFHQSTKENQLYLNSKEIEFGDLLNYSCRGLERFAQQHTSNAVLSYMARKSILMKIILSICYTALLNKLLFTSNILHWITKWTLAVTLLVYI